MHQHGKTLGKAFGESTSDRFAVSPIAPGHERARAGAPLQNNTERALAACSLWLYVGFIGATALAAGLLQLFDGDAKSLKALALAFFGGVLAGTSWRRGLTILEHADQASAVAKDASTSGPCARLTRNRYDGN